MPIWVKTHGRYHSHKKNDKSNNNSMRSPLICGSPGTMTVPSHRHDIASAHPGGATPNGSIASCVTLFQSPSMTPPLVISLPLPRSHPPAATPHSRRRRPTASRTGGGHPATEGRPKNEFVWQHRGGWRLEMKNAKQRRDDWRRSAVGPRKAMEQARPRPEMKSSQRLRGGRILSND